MFLNMEVTDEIMCLQSAFSPHEFEVLSSGKNENVLKFKIAPTLPSSSSSSIDILFKLPSSYPFVVPELSVNYSALKNMDRLQIEKEVYDYAQSMLGLPMIMDLVLKIKDAVIKHVSETQTGQKDKSENLIVEDQENMQKTFLAVLVIDHMRCKTKYIKTVKTWASELGASGALLFCQGRIFLILQASKSSVKDFIIRLKTTCIDVDSSGKKCKEKMSKVLFEGYISKCYDVFSVEEKNCLASFEEYLDEKGLNKILDFKQYFLHK